MLRFTRLVFRLNQSPFILEGTLKSYFEKYENMYLELIKKIRDDIYVDYLVTWGEGLQEVEKIKSDSIEMFEKGDFKLHKWHSNKPNLKTNNLGSQIQLNIAKEHLETKANESEILGLDWDKQRNNFRVEILTESQRLTKRNVLKTLASIYDPLGFISPVLLIGKILFHNLCDLRIPWDNEIPQEMENKWVKWIKGLNIKTETPRSISIRETITNIDINLFSDASINAVCTVAYVVIYQPNKISQGLITSKSRLVKRNVTIPRLKLIAAQMSANLSQNIKNSVTNQTQKVLCLVR